RQAAGNARDRQRGAVRVRQGSRRGRRRARRDRERARREVPRRGRPRRPTAPVRRRTASEDHEGHQGASVMSREFEVRREVDLPASPDDVWTAITADPAAWMFPTGMEIPRGAEPPEGAPVKTWDPPHRLVVRMESPDGTFNALDYLIEARDGGTAHLRYVHSGILADGWEDQYDAIGGHTDFYLHTLGQYLEHFNGRSVTYVGQPSDGISGPASAGSPDAMQTLRAALGVSSDAGVGDPVR